MPYHAPMSWQRRARLFRTGRDRALRLPREFNCPGNAVLLHMDGPRLVITPTAKPASLTTILDALEPLDEAFPDLPDAPPEPVDL